MPFLIELVKEIQSLSNTKFKEVSNSPHYLSSEHPDLWKKWLVHAGELPKGVERNSYWRETVREIRYWEEQEIDYMYQRVMELSRRVLGSQYFKVQMHSGEGTVPDQTSILNRLVELSGKLLSEIYPSILRLVHYRVDTIETHTPSVRGNIDWNKTVLRAVKTSAGTPTSFVCNSPKRSFSTPENLLLYTAVTWIFNDAVNLYSFQKIGSISNEDKRKIWAVLKSSKNILESFLLVEIKREPGVTKQFARPTPAIRPNLASIEKRLRYSANPQTPYLQLITWMRLYVDFNVNRYHNLANFTFQNIEDFDKMFELWVLFEMAYHIERMRNTRVKPLIEKKDLKGFKFEINNRVFTLRYEKLYRVPMGKAKSSPLGNQIKPDYTIETDELCRCGSTVRSSFDDDNAPDCQCGNFKPKVLLVMDAKNWRNRNRMEGVQKMIWYMVQMNEYRPETGILFFSNYEHDHDKKDPRTDRWLVTVNQGNWEFINYVVKSSRKPEYVKQLDRVFEQISSKLLLQMAV